mgnify:CR=1 FL=1
MNLDINDSVSKNIRNTREKKKLTLDMAAKVSGVSRSMLAQIEKGDVNPTLSVLWKIANGFKVSFSSLIEPIDQKTTSDVLQFFTQDGTKISVRPSGTEPKIKFYFEVAGELKNRGDFDRVEALSDAKIDAIMRELDL